MTVNDEAVDKSDNSAANVNENFVLVYSLLEKSKVDFSGTISDEYTEKVILFGYLIVSAVFNLLEDFEELRLI